MIWIIHQFILHYLQDCNHTTIPANRHSTQTTLRLVAGNLHDCGSNFYMAADIDEKLRMLMKFASEEEMYGDTFAERAEWFYQKRPQLLALLQDLYAGYIDLLDRCNRQEGKRLKQHCRSSSMMSTAEDDDHHGPVSQEREEHHGGSLIDSDAESTLSYQQLPTVSAGKGSMFFDIEEMVANVVMKNAEKDILLHRVDEMEQQGQESSRKIHLLMKLLEVLESERAVLLNENARLGYKVTTLLEENEGLSSESMFLKEKVEELASCLLQVREHHRVCMLARRIEDLQGQIYRLESRNQKYYEQLGMKGSQLENMGKIGTSGTSSMKEKNKDCVRPVAPVGCFQMEKLKSGRRNEAGSADNNLKEDAAEEVRKWWEWERIRKSMRLVKYCGSTK